MTALLRFLMSDASRLGSCVKTHDYSALMTWMYLDGRVFPSLEKLFSTRFLVLSSRTLLRTLVCCHSMPPQARQSLRICVAVGRRQRQCEQAAQHAAQGSRIQVRLTHTRGHTIVVGLAFANELATRAKGQYVVVSKLREAIADGEVHEGGGVVFRDACHS